MGTAQAPPIPKNGTVDDTEDPVERLTVEELHHALNDSGYICSEDRAESVLAALATRPIGGFFAFGPPGTGKTWILELLGDILGMNTFFKQCTPGSREEDLILDLLPDEDAESGIKKEWGPVPRAVEATKKKGPTLLILDEWDKTRPTADAFLLDFLQNGRVNYGDIRMEANMDNLYVGVTLNDERDLSGPAHRRLPYLHFEPLHPSLVRQALVESHGKHPYVEAAVNLYVRCELSQMEKKCTVQELRQLLDATSVLGDRADWDQLVLDYVTKDKDNHRLLKNAETLDVDDWEDDDIEALDPSEYGEVDDDGAIQETRTSSMPDIVEVKGYDRRTENDRDADLSESFAAIRKSDEVYDHFTRLEDPGEEPDDFGRVRVDGETITFDEPVPLFLDDTVHYKKWLDALNDGDGEIVFTEPEATRADMRQLQEEAGFKFTSYSEEEIIARADTLHVRWTEDGGAEEIIVSDPALFAQVLHGTWLTDPIQVGYEIPDKALAKMGHSDLGSVEARRKDLEVKDPYYAGIYDHWGQGNVDEYKTGDIPKYSEFMDLAEEEARDIEIVGDSIFVYFEGVTIGFLGSKNDHLLLSIYGEFREELDEYLQNWVPDGKMFLNRKITGAYLDEKDLIENHGFEVSKPSERRMNPARTLSRWKDGIKAVYGDGTLNVGAQLQGEKITHDRVGFIIGEIESTLQTL